jgi:hypothetical protein
MYVMAGWRTESRAFSSSAAQGTTMSLSSAAMAEAISPEPCILEPEWRAGKMLQSAAVGTDGFHQNRQVEVPSSLSILSAPIRDLTAPAAMHHAGSAAYWATYGGIVRT